MTSGLTLSESQVLWLNELGVSMLWGKALQASTPQTDALLVNKVVELPRVEQASVSLIKRSSPEGQTKSGRLRQEQRQAIQTMHQRLEQKANHERYQQRVNKHQPIPVVQSKDWISLKEEITQQYREWAWIGNHEDIFMGQKGISPLSLMIIEEMPSEDERMEHQAFLGDAGILLQNMLAAIGVNKTDVSMTSLLKIPMQSEALDHQYSQALPYLQAHIQLEKPRCLLLLGTRVAQPILHLAEHSFVQLRAQTWSYALSETEHIPVVVSYHPSLLLNNAALKAQAWEDLQKVAHYLQG